MKMQRKSSNHCASTSDQRGTLVNVLFLFFSLTLKQPSNMWGGLNTFLESDTFYAS